MRDQLLRLGVAGLLLVPTGAAACDREDRKDVKEVGEDVDKEIDKLDSDGKDD